MQLRLHVSVPSLMGSYLEYVCDAQKPESRKAGAHKRARAISEDLGAAAHAARPQPPSVAPVPSAACFSAPAAIDCA
eukprot:5303808-Amphidinium_carterae.1